MRPKSRSRILGALLFALMLVALGFYAVSEPDLTRVDPRPRLFIGSSREGLPVAEAIKGLLITELAVEIWNEGTVFGLGDATLEALEAAVLRYDFGLFVFTPIVSHVLGLDRVAESETPWQFVLHAGDCLSHAEDRQLSRGDATHLLPHAEEIAAHDFADLIIAIPTVDETADDRAEVGFLTEGLK